MPSDFSTNGEARATRHEDADVPRHGDAGAPRQGDADVPRSLRAFRGLHDGETILVCGCGSSLARVIAPERTITIGVNDVGRLFDPDYLVVLNPRPQFSAGRFAYVESSRAKAVFTQLDLGIRHPNLVRFRLGQRAGTDFTDPDVLPYTRNSPYLALCLAIHMKARRIGVLGVDFTANHFFADTGRHPLSAEVGQIDREYLRLYQSCRRMGIEVFNLSPDSLLTAFPKITQEEFLQPRAEPAKFAGRKVFFVNYRFLSCGDVFSDGLARAAGQLGLKSQAEVWDKPQIEKQIEAFDPELVFAVHGRKFSATHAEAIKGRRSAVWLLDEPYEVDDTSRFARRFDTTFLNDPSTLARHRNPHYLPVAYDPGAHFYSPGAERPHRIGFIGGFNPAREEALLRLARRNLLSYVVGGPWRDPALLQLCSSRNVPASETARLYRQTRIVINVFRRTHHYNAARIEAVSLNPRVYEALQCGALVISEHRAEIDTLCPELPTFRTLDELDRQIDRFLADDDLFARVRKACIRRLAGDTYADRLATVLEATLGEPKQEPARARVAIGSAPETVDLPTPPATKIEAVAELPAAGPAAGEELPPEIAMDWVKHGDAIRPQPDGSLLLANACEEGPGSELGLVSREKRAEIILEFEVRLEPASRFLAKIHLAEARDQAANSYHLMCSGGRAYLARHHHVLARITLPLEAWVPLSLSYLDGTVIVRRSGAEVARAADRTLAAGYCFLGVKGGSAGVRNIHVKVPINSPPRRSGRQPAVTFPRAASEGPAVSIVTTVYDRVGCLEECIRSVHALEFRDFEHIVVADLPPDPVLERIRKVIANSGAAQPPAFTCLEKRSNNWGIAPAARGLELARGRYVCFLSDDNGYKPNHFNKLVGVLDANPALGFVYSSCQYDGRFVLRSPVPRAGHIDLGQPLFRRELFDKYLGGTLPFAEYGWDWRMIERFMRSGVRWQHVNDDTFVFRLARYPHLTGRSLEVQA